MFYWTKIKFLPYVTNLIFLYRCIKKSFVPFKCNRLKRHSAPHGPPSKLFYSLFMGWRMGISHCIGLIRTHFDIIYDATKLGKIYSRTPWGNCECRGFSGWESNVQFRQSEFLFRDMTHVRVVLAVYLQAYILRVPFFNIIQDQTIFYIMCYQFTVIWCNKIDFFNENFYLRCSFKPWDL